MSRLKGQWATLGSQDASRGRTAYYKTILMLIPFFRRIRRYVFSYSGLKFCPSVSFSAVWPPLYKRTCGHFSSYNGKLLVNTIFVLANHTAATQCIWSCGRGEDTSLKFKASSGGRTRTWSDFEGGERGRVVSDGSLVCQRFTNCHCATVPLGFSPHHNHLEGFQRKQRQRPVSGSWLEEDAALMSEVRMGDLLEAVERQQ